MLRKLDVAHLVLWVGAIMRTRTLMIMATLVAGCIVGDGKLQVSDSSGNENELAVNEIVNEGEVLRVTASALNLRASGSTSATIIDSLPSGTLVTCAETSGVTGWVNVTTDSGDTGWVFGRYVVRDDAEAGGAASGETCSPSRAAGVIGNYQKALHDAIAYAEGTRGYSNDGYDVLFSYQLASSCQRHPNRCLTFGSTCSTAAGRYQFLYRTWSSVAQARNLGTFEPENQERGAAYLISTTRRVSVPQDRPMTATEFSNAMSKLSYEWASLPPGRYGQPNKTMTQMRSTYCEFAAC
jgi:muramidase (phage lysozyme)